MIIAYLYSAGTQHGNLHPTGWPILFCGPTQDPVFNADESVRVQFLPEPCMYPGGPPSVLEPTPQLVS